MESLRPPQLPLAKDSPSLLLLPPLFPDWSAVAIPRCSAASAEGRCLQQMAQISCHVP